MTARLVSRGPGLGVHSTAPLIVRCPFCHKPGEHGLIGRRDGADLLVDAVTAGPATVPTLAEYTPAELDRICTYEGLTAAQTGVQFPDPMMRQKRR